MTRTQKPTKRPALRAMGGWKWLSAPFLLWVGVALALYNQTGLSVPSRPLGVVAPVSGLDCGASLAMRPRGETERRLFPVLDRRCQARVVSALLQIEGLEPLGLNPDPGLWRADVDAHAFEAADTIRLVLDLPGGSTATAVWRTADLKTPDRR